MRKKGFSLIELLAVIILLGIIVTFATISIAKFLKNSNKNMCIQKEKYIVTSAIEYGKEHLNDLNKTSDSHYKICADGKKGYVITVDSLMQLGYISGDNDDTPSLLLIPGQPNSYNTSFNPKTVCIRYENIFSNIDLENYTSSYNYHGNTNYQVTAQMNESQCID